MSKFPSRAARFVNDAQGVPLSGIEIPLCDGEMSVSRKFAHSDFLCLNFPARKLMFPVFSGTLTLGIGSPAARRAVRFPKAAVPFAGKSLDSVSRFSIHEENSGLRGSCFGIVCGRSRMKFPIRGS